MMDCVKRYIEAIIKNLDRTFKCVGNRSNTSVK